MKNCGILLILLALLFSCHQKDDLTPAKEGFITAKKNGESWTVPGETQFYGDTLIIWGLGQEEVLSFLIEFDGEGIYELKDSNAAYYTTVGGDVLTSRYQVEENKVEELVIKRYDPNESIIEGSFNFRLSSTVPSNDVPVAMEFLNGSFRLHIADK